MQSNEETRREQRQRIANEYHKKIYVYLLENGNQFSTLEPMMEHEKIGGAKVKKLLEIIKPENNKGANNE